MNVHTNVAHLEGKDMSRLWPVIEDLSPRWYELANMFKSLDSRLISHSNFSKHSRDPERVCQTV